jgi:hypothetical protein
VRGLTVNPRIALACGGSIFVAMAAGCNSDSSPSSGAVAAFQQTVSTLIQFETCETATPINVNSGRFLFDPNQDQAEPVDVNSLNPGCSFPLTPD